MAATRAYRGVPADKRHAQRRSALIEAAIDGLEVDGLSGVSVRSVCARARLTPRYFYQSFADLDHLLLAAVDSVTDEVAAQAFAAMTAAGDAVEAQVRAAIDAGYGVVATDRGKANVLLVASTGDGLLRERRNKLVTDYADLVIDGLPLLNSLGLAERRRARAVALFLIGGSCDVIEAVLAKRLRLSRAALVDQLTSMWLGALSASLPGARLER